MLVYDSKVQGFTYTPQDEKKVKVKPFKVKLKLLSVEQLAELNDLVVTRTATEVKSNYGAYLVQACLKGITDWENLQDTEGNDIIISKSIYGTIDSNSLNMIPYKIIEDIGTVIINVSENPKNISVFADK